MKTRTIYAVATNASAVVRLRWRRNDDPALPRVRWWVDEACLDLSSRCWQEAYPRAMVSDAALALYLAHYNREGSGWRLTEREPTETINALKGATAHAH